MVDLSTKYMGLELRNPIVVASCSLTGSPEGIVRCADAGAGAVVLKSVFEEQINAELNAFIDDLDEHVWLSGHPEAYDYIQGMGMQHGPRQYLKLVEEAKRSVDIPVIASLNCVSPKWWVDYAVKFEAVGVDALELNIALMPTDPTMTNDNIEASYFKILKSVKSNVDIPVSVKIPPYFTAVARVATQLCNLGASAIVLFNRLYKFDIDIDEFKLTSGARFSSPQEISQSLRWISLLAGNVDCDLACSTGVHNGAGAIKQLLAGASVVQICSTLYLNGVKQVPLILEQMMEWMERHEFDTIDQMRGRLSQEQSENPEQFERIQYVKALVGIE